MKRAAVAVPVLLSGVVLVALLASCGADGSSSDSKADSGSSGGSTAAGDSSLVENGSANDSSTRAKAAPTTRQAAAPLSRAVISTGRVSLQSTSIAKARSRVMSLVDSWNGNVADEQSNSDARGRMVDSTMTLRVPTATFSQAMNELARLGKVEQQSRKSQDVTTKVLDNDARVRAAERSIRQIELLLGRAKELRDVITIESDLARRQADLDSLKSQQAYLEDQTSLSTITVFLAQPDTVAPREDEARGFLAGLDDGWDAFRTTTVALLTVVGAVLPFAVVLALVGVPLWLVVRRRLGGRVSAASAPARSA